VSERPSAREQVRVAHERIYRLPEGFPGFSADVNGHRDGDRWHGRLHLRTPQQLSLEGADGSAGPAWLRDEIASWVGHRWPGEFENGDGRNDLRFDGEPGTDGQRIALGDAMDSTYLIRDGDVVQVQRTAGPQRFTIDVLDWTPLGGRHVSRCFTVVYRSAASGAPQRVDAFSDEYAAVGSVWLPRRRRVIVHTAEGVSQRQLDLTAHSVIEASDG
jgi:hypothetical protein